MGMPILDLISLGSVRVAGPSARIPNADVRRFIDQHIMFPIRILAAERIVGPFLCAACTLLVTELIARGSPAALFATLGEALHALVLSLDAVARRAASLVPAISSPTAPTPLDYANVNRGLLVGLLTHVCTALVSALLPYTELGQAVRRLVEGGSVNLERKLLVANAFGVDSRYAERFSAGLFSAGQAPSLETLEEGSDAHELLLAIARAHSQDRPIPSERLVMTLGVVVGRTGGGQVFALLLTYSLGWLIFAIVGALWQMGPR